MRNSWAHNISWSFGSNVAGKFLSFILMIIAARILGPSIFGKFSFIFSYVFLFSALTDLGLRNLIIRDIAQKTEKTNTCFGNSFYLRLLLLILTWILSPLIASHMHFSSKEWLIFLFIMVTLTSDSLALSYEGVLMGHERADLPSLQRFIKNLICFILSSMLLLTGGGVLGLALGYATGSVSSLLFLTSRSRRIIPHLALEATTRGVYLLARLALPFAVIAGIRFLYARIDMIMIALIRSDYEAGLYSVAYRLNEALIFIPLILSTASYPTISRYIKEKNRAGLDHILKNTLMILGGLYLPLALAAWSAPKSIITLLFGRDYISSASSFWALMTALLFSTLIAPLMVTITAYHKQNRLALFSGGLLLLNILLNFLWIPSRGAAGAALAFAVSEGVGLILYSLIALKLIRSGKFLMGLYPLFFAGSLFFIGWLFFQPLPPLFRLLGAELFYTAGAGAIILYFRKDPLQALFPKNGKNP